MFPLFPKNKGKTEPTEKSTTLLGSRRERRRTQGKPLLPRLERQGVTEAHERKLLRDPVPGRKSGL